mmetsp:Transcript_4464/g.10372  ORF Transcript_4464/g.10372 Transcript_4464/m.10372 type:complete len:233 (+) Transcript_4464:35-733(+)
MAPKLRRVAQGCAILMAIVFLALDSNLSAVPGRAQVSTVVEDTLITKTRSSNWAELPRDDFSNVANLQSPGFTPKVYIDDNSAPQSRDSEEGSGPGIAKSSSSRMLEDVKVSGVERISTSLANAPADSRTQMELHHEHVEEALISAANGALQLYQTNASLRERVAVHEDVDDLSMMSTLPCHCDGVLSGAKPPAEQACLKKCSSLRYEATRGGLRVSLADGPLAYVHEHDEF